MNAYDREIFKLLCKIAEENYQPTQNDLRRINVKESLDLSNFKLDALPQTIVMLKSLTELHLCHTSISTIPEYISQLSSLQILDISDTNIEELPESIECLSALKTINLSKTKVEHLPNCIGHFDNLEEINLSQTRITELPESIGNLKALKKLKLYDTRISELPNSIGSLSSLNLLDISCTHISCLPDSFIQLRSLKVIDLGNTPFSTLPDAICNLTTLHTLVLHNSCITSLPEWIGDLPSIKRIDLSSLTLPRIPKSLALRGLPFYDDSTVKLFIRKKEGINLSGTNLSYQKKSVFLYTPELIPSLYEEQITLRECKVIFLGDGDSGKSYTIRRFRSGGRKESPDYKYDTRETPGVEIADYHVNYDKEQFDIHFWDFGGQQLLHSMHRCFLTEQTCYVVTVKSRETRATQRARYWLRNVKAFAPNSPVLLYVNCWDNDDGTRCIDEYSLRQDFDNISHVTYCSAKEASESVFQSTFMLPLIQMASSSDGCRQTVNMHWDQLRKDIIKENENYLTKERYHTLCLKNGIKDENAAGLLTFFNNLGVCFSYHRDKDRKELADYKLLNPVWLTNALYAIIEEGMAGAQEGKITVNYIQQMLVNAAPKTVRNRTYRRTMPDITYKPIECQYIIDVASAYNLCYRISQEKLFFPALCSNNTPNGVLNIKDEFPQHVSYQLKYSYLPDSVIHQLMVRCLKRDLVINCSWSKGMVLGGMDSYKAVVKMAEDDETLIVDIFSKSEYPPYVLFQLIKEEISQINNSINLTAEEYIVDDKDRYTLISLLSAAKDKGSVYGPTTGKKQRAEDLLGKLYFDWVVRAMQVEKEKIVIRIPQRYYHKRKKDDRALRVALYEAYNRICPYCRRPMENIRDIEVDHILPTKYIPRPELVDYIRFLQESGFDIEHPDYIENYFPSHPSCNRDKLNDVDIISLPYRHEIAYKRAPQVIRLIEKYEDRNPQKIAEFYDREIEPEA